MEVSVYVIHNNDAARRKHISNVLQGYKITLVNRFAKAQLDLNSVIQNIKINHAKDTWFHDHSKRLTPDEISCVLNHMIALQMIASSSDSGGYVLEDDIICKNQRLVLKPCGETQWNGLVMLGKDKLDRNVATLSPITTNDYLHSCHAYYISKDAAIKLSERFYPIVFHTPMQLTMLCHQLMVPIRFDTDDQLLDGSKHGDFVSTVCTNNLHILDPVFVKGFAFANGHDSSVDLNNPNIKILLSDLGKRENPDYTYLAGRLYKKGNDLLKAKEYFKVSLEQYEKQNALILSNSNFMNEYIQLCKMLS